jgi:hypothetical protein
MSLGTVTEQLKDKALRLGVDLVGARPAVAPPGFHRFRQWLADGYAGGMRYLVSRAEALRASLPRAGGGAAFLCLRSITEPPRLGIRGLNDADRVMDSISAWALSNYGEAATQAAL